MTVTKPVNVAATLLNGIPVLPKTGIAVDINLNNPDVGQRSTG